MTKDMGCRVVQRSQRIMQIKRTLSIHADLNLSLSLSLSSSFFSSRRSLTTPIDMAVFLPPDSFTIPCQSKPVFIVMSFGNSAV